MLVNLRVDGDRTAKITFDNATLFENLCARNVEGGVAELDTTIRRGSMITVFDTLHSGEGKLYQVAPVVKYGGKLLYNETISSTTTLLDEMVIQNGATLTVNSTYNAYANIKIKEGGRIVTTNGGTINFFLGCKLIIEGTATIAGTSQHKLILDFGSPANDNGIIIRSGGSLTISYCEIKNAVTGINSELNANYLNAQFVDFIDCASIGINILGRSPGQAPTPPPQISYCTITNTLTGISITNLSQMTIQQNTITNTDLGLFISGIANVQIISNQINSNSNELDAILEVSCGGVTRGNIISGHTIGLHLANSSIDVGGNLITDCLYHAMFIGDGSNPNMQGKLAGNPPRVYPISGYNHFENNGGYEGGLDDNDGSEIYFNRSNTIMTKGCNSIVDDRKPGGELINTFLLMNCPDNPLIEIHAEQNYWGETMVSPGRFGNLNVHYDNYYTDPCNYVPIISGVKLIVKTSDGEVIDTLYPISEEISSLSEMELLYADAEKLFITGDIESSENYYDQIIAIDTSLSVKKEAYTRKYEIGKLLNRNSEYFQGLRNIYSSLSASTTDSLLQKIFSQLASLCLVAKEEYIPAISEFDEIIQQNPNSEEAVYAEIDALTAALLVEGNDSTMQKGRLGKYLVKSSGDYNSKLDGLLRKHFGRNAKETEEETLPTEYTLYQNFPNPFNPTTTIKYDLPNTSDVSLIIYDILGRKVKELVNTKQQAGRYEIQFNASTLASGVYIYQLIADKYISSKKMILLK